MKKRINIGKRQIGQGNPVFIIAEAGVNHNGSLKLAKKMVDAAKKAGADAVKFQTYKTEELVTKGAPKAEYQKKSGKNISQYDMLKGLELSEDDFKVLFDYSKKKKIMFLSSPFDYNSADFLNELGVPAFKIGSGELTNIHLLTKISKYGKPIILSTGMATLDEIKLAVKNIYAAKNNKLILLHCITSYPTEYDEVNLRAIATLQRQFKIPVGYSDHTRGIEVSIAAASMGAIVIEKHFTLSNKLPGPDHKVSVEPKELSALIKAVRNVEACLGDGRKVPQRSEEKIKLVARKSIVANRDIKKGTVIRKEMLSIKRPGSGMAPANFMKMIGKKTKKNIRKDELLNWGMV